MNGKARREEKRRKREAAEQAARAPTPHATAQEANEDLAETARILNMAEKRRDAEKVTAAKSGPAARVAKAPKVTRDGRLRLPPLPKASKPKPLVPCECGCKNLTRSRFYPGHDSRMRGWILRLDRKLIKPSDIPDGEREAVQAFIRARDKGKTDGAGKVDGKGKADGKGKNGQSKAKRQPDVAAAPIDAGQPEAPQAESTGSDA